MTSVVEFLISAPLILKAVSAVLLLFSVVFVLVFVGRGLRVWFVLSDVLTKLQRVDARREQSLEGVFAGNHTFSHLWKEYKDTLHRQQDFDPNGRPQVVVLRSTVPAAMVFTNEIIVDTPLATEFFKHLPGIFTGIGIIGTFWGLISGIGNFTISSDPNDVHASLQTLMQAVSSAFKVSATAILLAMLATFIEKSLVTVLYKKVEDVSSRLDGFFHSGAAEEYLARLTRASEETSTQSQLLKDALVTDLRQILTDLTTRQIEAFNSGHATLGKELADKLKEILGKPLEDMRDGFKRTTEGNSEAVAELMKDVLAAFRDKMEGLFGGQIAGINELQQKTVDALNKAVEKLNGMATAIEGAGIKASDAINERLIVALRDMEIQQTSSNQRMTEFVEQIRKLVADSQSETAAHLQKTLADLGEALNAQLRDMENRGEKADEEHHERARTLAATADAAVAKLSGVVETLLGRVDEVTTAVRELTEAMRTTTVGAINKMNSGADSLLLAAGEFATASEKVSGIIRDAGSLSQGLGQAAELGREHFEVAQGRHGRLRGHARRADQYGFRPSRRGRERQEGSIPYSATSSRKSKAPRSNWRRLRKALTATSPGSRRYSRKPMRPMLRR